MPVLYADGLLVDSPPIKVLSDKAFQEMVAKTRGHDFIFEDDPRTLEGLVLCNMGGECGLGLFTQHFIPKGTVVIHYTGVISTSPEPGDMYILKVREGQYISPRRRGNLAGFIQHLDSYSQHKHYTDEIALENLCMRADSEGSVIFEATRDIQANEILGYPYDHCLESYWAGLGKIPREFDRFGRVLPYEGAIFGHAIFSLRVNIAMLLKNTAMLDHLRLTNIKTFDFIYESTSTGISQGEHPMNRLIGATFLSHADLLKLLYPADRDVLLKILSQNHCILKPSSLESTSPYAENRVVKHVKWGAPKHSTRVFTSDFRQAHLDFKEDFFKIVNPLRYYALQEHPKSKRSELHKKIKSLTEWGAHKYITKQYAQAAHAWENALHFLRDYLFELSVDERFESVRITRSTDKGWVIQHNPELRILSLNLGRAYFNAAHTEDSKYKRQYLEEAELCIRVTLEILKTTAPSAYDDHDHFDQLLECEKLLARINGELFDTDAAATTEGFTRPAPK